MVCHIFWHGDSDGALAGALMERAIKYKWIDSSAIYNTEDTSIKLHRWNYGWSLKWVPIKPKDVVIFVDFTPLNEEIEWVRSTVKEKLIIIDHHATAIERIAPLLPIDGIQSANAAGCEQTFEWIKLFLLPNKLSSKEISNLEEFAELIGDYDTFRSYEDKPLWKNLLRMQYAFRTIDINPETGKAFWEDFFENVITEKEMPFDVYVRNIFDLGKPVLIAFENQYADEVKSYGFEAFIENQKFFCINRPAQGSTMFASIADDLKKKGYNGVANFVYHMPKTKEPYWSFHLYSLENTADYTPLTGFNGHKTAGSIRCKSWKLDANKKFIMEM